MNEILWNVSIFSSFNFQTFFFSNHYKIKYLWLENIYIYTYIHRFKPGRDIGSLEALLDRLSLRMDLPRGARHIFSMDGDRKLTLDELEDGASYVVSSYKTFKVTLVFYLYTMYAIKILNNALWWFRRSREGGGGWRKLKILSGWKSGSFDLIHCTKKK